ncbi:MAG: hypothetical protein JJT78_16460 [Leptospira sp.]|nr:hypothetical protein [Leptospira sp.]
MQIKEYFTIQFKKPVLGDDEKTREEKKKTLNEKLEKAYSRLESIEILNSNSKTDDMFILTTHLIQDLYNLSAEYYGLELVNTASGLKDKIDNLPDDGLRNLYKDQERLITVSSIEKPTEEEAEVLEEQASKLLLGLEKFFKKTKKTELHTTMDDFKKRLAVQGTILISILTLSIGSVIYNKVKYPIFEDDQAQIYFMTPEFPNPTDANSVKQPVLASQKGEWLDYRFPIPADNSELIGIRIDPVNQRKVRFGLQYVQYLDVNGKVIFERDFKLTENLIPSNVDQIGIMNDLKAGVAKPGGFAEMESVGSDPFFYLNLPKTKNVAFVQLRMRFLEGYKKFKD